MNLIIPYLVVLGFTTCVLQIFFKGSCAYCHILELLKKFGFKKSNKEFWNYKQKLSSIELDLDVENFTFGNAIEFISEKSKWLGQLLSCPYCLSWHLTFWSLILTFLGSYFIYNLTLPFWLFIITLFTVPYLANFLLQKLD